jgi:exosortase C (VPDSG-CTERM-specific)
MTVDPPASVPDDKRRHLPAGFIIAAAVLLICFSEPLFTLMRFALSSELYSYIILIPFIGLYLVWIKKGSLRESTFSVSKMSVLFLLGGLGFLGLYFAARQDGARLELEDSLALTTLSFVLLFWALCASFVAKPVLRSIIFPLGLLILMAPLPVFLRSWIESSLQYGSAMAALGMFSLTGTPVFYYDLNFQLPDITIQVAPECSGIHSTVALLITSLVAGHLFLRSNWRRSIVVIAVIPLALLRNGFRIFTIGELCVHIGPEMIHSYIHKKGGPVFFVLSLVPFLLLLYYLIKSDRRGAAQNPSIP